MRVVRVLFCGVSLVLSLPVCGQGTDPATTSTGAVAEQAPSDPAELLRLASGLNRIIYPDAKPWHLKAEYEVLDSNGHKTDRGVYEVFWSSPKQVKQSYASKTFSQTSYLTEKGVMRIGDMRGASGPERVVATRTFARMPGDDTLARTSQQLYAQTIEGKQYRCIALNSRQPVAANSALILRSYCLDMDRLALRYERGTGTTSSELSGLTSLNDITVFHGHFVAKDIRVSHFDKPYVHIHLDVLEDLSEVKDADFEPPPGAAPAAPARPVVHDGEMRRRLTYHTDPPPLTSFLVMDRERVILSVLVGKDGTVTGIRSLGGMKELVALTSKAVAGWVYRPYLVNGQPVEVETEVVEEFKSDRNQLR